MENPIARDQIPESWVEKSRCPYCSSAPLWVQHPVDQPDYFVCPICEMSFNVAQDQPSVFILEDPIGVTTGFQGKWVEMKALMQSTQTNKPAAANQSPVKEENPAPREPILHSLPVDSPEGQDPIYQKYSPEVIENAAELYAMGNSRQKIKGILASYSHLSDEECDEIIEFISRRKTGEKNRTIKLPRWALGCVVVPFLCLLLYGLMVFFRYQSASNINASADPQIVSIFQYENLPESLRKIIPADIQAVQSPIPLVEKMQPAGGEVQACPATADEAVQLFGGEASDWEYKSGQKAWTLQSTYARDITEPEGYLVIITLLDKGLSIQLVPGPAKIYNAYQLLIRCP